MGCAAATREHVDFVAGFGESVRDIPDSVLYAATRGLEALDDQCDAHGGRQSAPGPLRPPAAGAGRHSEAQGLGEPLPAALGQFHDNLRIVKCRIHKQAQTKNYTRKLQK